MILSEQHTRPSCLKKNLLLYNKHLGTIITHIMGSNNTLETLENALMSNITFIFVYIIDIKVQMGSIVEHLLFKYYSEKLHQSANHLEGQNVNATS